MRGIISSLSLGAILILASIAGAQEAPAPDQSNRLVGQLIDQDGKPLSGIKLCLCTEKLSIFNTKSPPEDTANPVPGYVYATTDAEGRFSFPPQISNYTLLTFTDDGYLI